MIKKIYIKIKFKIALILLLNYIRQFYKIRIKKQVKLY